MDAETKSTCPVNVEGPARDRVELANSGAFQADVLLTAALTEMDAMDQEDSFVLRALVSRARRLCAAGTVLLSLDALESAEADHEALDNAENEVNRG